MYDWEFKDSFWKGVVKKFKIQSTLSLFLLCRLLMFLFLVLWIAGTSSRFGIEDIKLSIKLRIVFKFIRRFVRQHDWYDYWSKPFIKVLFIFRSLDQIFFTAAATSQWVFGSVPMLQRDSALIVGYFGVVVSI